MCRQVNSGVGRGDEREREVGYVEAGEWERRKKGAEGREGEGDRWL